MSDRRRRDFLRVTLAGTGAATLAACGGDTGSASSPDPAASPAPVAKKEPLGDFLHGVASGDPEADRVILWTRLTPRAEIDDENEIAVGWQIARDPGFTTLTASGEAVASREADWTVKVDATGLEPASDYHYRFTHAATASPVGRTRTLPTGAVDDVSLAVVSCANYQAGHFNVYRDLAERDDIDCLLHLGDYLYEDGADGFAAENAETLGRTLPPDNDAELLTLTDYRRRYAHYRSDTDLMAAHARLAFIAIQDDHEIANNVWRAGAANHDASEGDFSTRRDAAIRAWFEWMPVRVADSGDPRERWRHFAFGDLVELCMLDARESGRDEAVDRNDYLDPGSRTLAMTPYLAALNDPNRRMLGDRQFAWLSDRLQLSSARWQVLGQQVPMARLTVPAELRIDPDRRGSPANLADLAELVDRGRADESALSEAERQRVNTRIPYYQDGWDGYPAERDRLLATAAGASGSLVTLAGDTHNAWCNRLTAADGSPVGVEFATTAITSPGASRLFGVDEPAASADVESALVRVIDDTNWINILERGYLVVSFTRDEVIADYVLLESVSRRGTGRSSRGRRWRARHGEHRPVPDA